MKKIARPANQGRRQRARSISGQISVVPLYMTTALACLVVFGAVCMKVSDGHNESKALVMRSSIERQGVSTETDVSRYEGRPDGARGIDTRPPTADGELLESLMREKARQIRSHRAKGVQIAMGAPVDSLSENNLITPTPSAFE